MSARAIIANAEPGDIRRGLTAGLLGYLTRPHEPAPLQSEINRVPEHCPNAEGYLRMNGHVR
jgi:CheY-like chemotaxis protein